MTTISSEYIAKRSAELLAQCYSIRPKESWVHPFTGLELVQMKAKYGEALLEGRVHRKTKRYSEYHLKPKHLQRDINSITGKKVARYEFKPYS